MEKEKAIDLILLSLNKKSSDIFKKGRVNSPEITYYKFIDTILSSSNREDILTTLSISEQTFNRALKKQFPDVKLKGGNETWSHYLLSLAELKKCFKCGYILHLKNFINNSQCKECRHVYNLSPNRQIRNRESQRKYYHNNTDYFYFKTAKYRALKHKAMPKWADIDKIKQFYFNCQEGFHVDHIIPLQGKYICGLHVYENLQYLRAEDNLRKSNYHESEEYWK